jgi:very-short-patch-repair endonuclease
MDNINFIVCDGVKWYKGKDVAELLEYVNTAKAVYMHVSSQDKRNRGELENIPKTGFYKNEMKTIYITDRGVKSLVSKSRMMKATNIAKDMGLDILDHKYVTKEAETLDAIIKAFTGENMRLQYKVKDYKVDLYFPDYNLCIECDENGHSEYNADADRKRTRIITKRLQCKWIRFNPDGKDFNIFTVINQIFTVIKTHV